MVKLTKAKQERIKVILSNIVEMRSEFECALDDIEYCQENEGDLDGLADTCHEMQPHVDQWAHHIKELIDLLEGNNE